MSSPANVNRSAGLDYLRTASILIVIFNHFLISFFFATGKIKFDGLIALISASAVVSIEWLFVLSGFLIGAMMIRSFERSDNWATCARDFWLRRWFRTVPTYYLFLLINYLLVKYHLTDGAFEYRSLFFSQNLFEAEQTPHFFGESWSLALDEWFYLTMPIMLGLLSLLFPLGGKKSFLIASALLIVVPVIGRIAISDGFNFFQWDAFVRRITIYHLDATGWGVFAAVVNKWFPAWWRSGIEKKLGLGLALMLLGTCGSAYLVRIDVDQHTLANLISIWSITLMSGGTFLIIPWLSENFKNTVSSNRVVETISLYSYSIYLCHFPTIVLVKYFFDINQTTSSVNLILTMIFCLAMVLLSARLVFHSFEKPISDLRERFTKKVNAAPF
jgi:peptidoglycan/LPS O-acetylase OafA/YrhL